LYDIFKKVKNKLKDFNYNTDSNINKLNLVSLQTDENIYLLDLISYLKKLFPKSQGGTRRCTNIDRVKQHSKRTTRKSKKLNKE
jgi:hypothetical protein